MPFLGGMPLPFRRRFGLPMSNDVHQHVGWMERALQANSTARGRLRCHGRSMIIDTALPPPRQRVARPPFAARSFIAYAKVVTTRAPLQPIGGPSDTAPPSTLTVSCETPSSRITDL